MQTHAAVFRTGSVLSEGCQKIDEIYNQTEDLKVSQDSPMKFSTARNSLLSFAAVDSWLRAAVSSRQNLAFCLAFFLVVDLRPAHKYLDSFGNGYV